METIRYSPIAQEDLQLGSGTFEVTLADGRVVVLTAIDLIAIINNTTLSPTRTMTGITLSAPTLTGAVVFGAAPTFSSLTANSFLYSGAAGLLSATAAPTNGQLLIGNTGSAPSLSTLTQGNGTLITNGAGSVTLNALSSYRVLGNNSLNNGGTPNTQFDLVADVVMLRDSNNTVIVRHNPGSITNNVLTTGPAANGRDQSSAFSASSWIHLYWIWNGQTLATVSSATAPPTGPTLPASYTHWAYCGAVYFDGSSHLLKTRIKGASCFYEAQQSALSSGAATTETAVSLTTLIPPNAMDFQVGFTFRATTVNNATGQDTVAFRVVTGSDFAAFGALYGTTTNTELRQDAVLKLPNISQQMYYQITGAGINTNPKVDLWIQSYRVPNGGA